MTNAKVTGLLPIKQQKGIQTGSFAVTGGIARDSFVIPETSVYNPPPGPPPVAVYLPPPGPPPPNTIPFTSLPPSAQPLRETFNNRIPGGIEVDIRSAGLGVMRILPDETIAEGVLSLLNAQDLVTLSNVSRILYIFARDDQQWRRICLERWGRAGSVSGGLVFKGTWRLTYYFPGTMNESFREKFEFARVHAHCSLTVDGLVSPYLHAKWCRCHMDLSRFHVDTKLTTAETTIERVSGRTLTAVQFQSRYESLSKPIVIAMDGIASSWPALTTWSLKALLTKYGDIHFKVGNEYGHPRKVGMKFSSYVDYMLQQNDESPLYVFDDRFAEKAPDMLRDYEVPSIFAEDFLSVLGEERPPFRWLVIGPARSGASWHIDPLGTSAWNTLLSGRKRWALYPPDKLPPGVHPSDLSSPSTLYWYLEVYPFLPPELKPIEIVQEPGETIVVPAGWWHAVLNLDQCNIAITQNWCGRWNLDGVVEEMASSLENKYHKLYWKFRQRMIEEHPNLGFVFDSFGRTTDPLILAEGYATKGEFCQGFTSEPAKWIPRINQVWEREFGHEGPVEEEDVEPMEHLGENPIYFHFESERVIKFYSHLGRGLVSYASEVDALTSIGALPQTSLLHAVCPQMVAHGMLFKPGPSSWPWPYGIQTHVGSEESHAMGESANLFTPGDWINLTNWIGTVLRELHRTPVRQSKIILQGEDTTSRDWTVYLRKRIKAARRDHTRWGHLPSALISTLEDYIQQALPAISPNVSDLGFPSANLLHGDLTAGNIIGHWKLDQTSQRNNWVPTHIIDFGDAFLAPSDSDIRLDPLWDMAFLYVTTLRCQVSLLHRLLDIYLGCSSWRSKWSWIRERMCAYVLLWSYEAGIKGIKGNAGIPDGIDNWHEFEVKVFGEL
ncbi:uncharacterized protein SPPG_06354 [Spizellomyces punctatus DAOM BR117]|uniref:JmjC domain-containing protein n=1 Tax=Spizellomyces punctatus (strain DAOM BR117) TaxID=645134 RepID=A0A0L0HCJ3_SPIPD|nr:uncharacterized protein SPPG_06354 [Spizellomyces punctatus DAOM BR117]KNC98671.1 hypothetical protein SPPG_06354 [Spizellomyces punctatus DAOM BR117]|eukprot:XP_016606711.1 hypothetical protein SPPG_06354 [Spizellomyces punctatus DAOM BR117]